jgi:hypothetical protein
MTTTEAMEARAKPWRPERSGGRGGSASEILRSRRSSEAGGDWSESSKSSVSRSESQSDIGSRSERREEERKRGRARKKLGRKEGRTARATE